MNNEDHLQASCLKWFRATYPDLRACIFSVPNGGLRNKITQAQMITTGLTPGIPDLILIVRGRALGIEMKVPGGVLSPAQKGVHEAWTRAGNTIVVVRDEESFKKEIKKFLGFA